MEQHLVLVHIVREDIGLRGRGINIGTVSKRLHILVSMRTNLVTH